MGNMDLSMTVLVVDDFATMRRILKNIFRQLGFENVIETDDGTTALEALKKNKIDLIVSDWNMPKMTGLELLKTVRTSDEYKDIRIADSTRSLSRHLVHQKKRSVGEHAQNTCCHERCENNGLLC